MKPGYVYVLTNKAMPGLYKIGSSKNQPQHRADQLSSNTAVPWPFDVFFSATTPDCYAGEMLLHKNLGDFRVNGSREFFAFSRESRLWLVNVLMHLPQASEWQCSKHACEAWAASDLANPWVWDDEIDEWRLDSMPKHAPMDDFEQIREEG